MNNLSKTISAAYRRIDVNNLLVVLALILVLCIIPEAHSQPISDEASRQTQITPAIEQSIERGLTYLAHRQREDGTVGTGFYDRNVGVCALTGMAFLASGSTPGRGPYGEHVDRCISYLVDNASDSGFINAPAASSYGPMYGHGFATLFLAEVYGMSQRDDLRPTVARAVRLILETQNESGGWRYQAERSQADISVTVCQVMALRAARNSGIHVPTETIDRAISYVKRSQNADGGFMYRLSEGGESGFSRSAAGLVALYSAGVYEGEEVDKALAYLDQDRFLPTENGHRESYFYYGHYYAVQAMWHADGARWDRWYPAISRQLLEEQRDDGSWPDDIGPAYATAMALIILQMPNDYVPVFQR